MPRKKKSNSATAEQPVIVTSTVEQQVIDHVNIEELSLKSLYEMIVLVQQKQKVLQDNITKCLDTIIEVSNACNERSNTWTSYIDDTWKNISSGLVLLGGKLEKLDKQVRELNLSESRANKLVVKGVPVETTDESLKDYIGSMFASLQEEIKDFSVERIYIKDKPGPVKVLMKTEDDAIRVLKKKHGLSNSEIFNNVYVSPWLSRQQLRTEYNIRQLAKVNQKVKFLGGQVHVS